jgi:hypothetical protein
MSGTQIVDKDQPGIDGALEPDSDDSAPSRANRREAWLLASLVAVGAALLCAWTLKIRQFGIQTDELLYVKLASNIADTLSPLPVVHGESYGQPTPAYPLLLSILVGPLPMPTAFVAAHALNAVLMASAAIPTYVLARAIGVTPVWGFLAATLAIAMPWTTFSYYLTTESLAYPVFVWAVLAIQGTVVAGGMRNDALALAAIGAAVLTRTQFVVLAGVLPVAVLLHAALENRLRDRLASLRDAVRTHRLLFAVVAIAALVVGIAALLGAGSRVAGNYHSLLEGDLMVRETLGAVPEHLTLLIVGASVVPFAVGAAWSLDALFRPSRPRARAYVIVMTLTLIATVLLTAAFNRSQLGEIVADRYAFYVVPLIGVAFVAGLQRAALLAPVAVFGGTGLVLAVLARFPDAAGQVFSVISPWYDVLNDRSEDVGRIVGIDSLGSVALLRAMALVAAIGVLACRRGPRWHAWAAATLGVLVLIASSAQTVHVLDSNLTTINTYPSSQGKLVAQDIARDNRDWVDDAVPDGQGVAIVPGVVGDFKETRWLWWDVESWNESVDRSYDFAPGWTDTPFPDRSIMADPQTGQLAVAGEKPARYLVLPAHDRRMSIAGVTVALRSPLRLVRAGDPARAAWSVRGTDRDGWSAAGKPVYVRVYPRGRASLAKVRIQLTSTPPVKQRRRFSVTGGINGIVAPGKQVSVSTQVCVPANSPADVRIRVGGRTELPTGRLAGLAITDVRVRLTGACSRP